MRTTAQITQLSSFDILQVIYRIIKTARHSMFELKSGSKVDCK